MVEIVEAGQASGGAGLTKTKGKSMTTTLSSAAMKVAANAECFSWPMHAARSSALAKVMTKTWVKPCVSASWFSTSLPLQYAWCQVLLKAG